MGRELRYKKTMSKTIRIKLRDDLTDDVREILTVLNGVHLELRLFLEEFSSDIDAHKDLERYRRLKNISTAIQECIT